MTEIRLAVITTSFPRFEEDEASLFLGRSIDALSSQGARGYVSVPHDSVAELSKKRGNFELLWRKYGVFQRGQLAFGQGILPNLRRNPLLILQVPMLLFQLFLGAFSKRNSWDLVHGHWVITAIPAYLLHLFTGKPFIITVRGEDIKLLRTPLRYVLIPLLKSAAHLTTVSDEFKREVSEICPALEQKISTVPNGITRFHITEEQRQKLREKLHIPPHFSHVLTYVGRVVHLKQPTVLIEMLAELKNSECCLVLAGRITESYREELFEFAEQHGVREQVRIPGTLEPVETGTLYALSWIYLSASSHEGRSNAVLEALAAGVPACLSDIPGHRELVNHNENGLLFDGNEPTEAARLLRELLENEGLYKNLSKQASHSVESLTWEACAALYIEHFTRVLRAERS